MDIFELSGWSGAILFIAAYVMLSARIFTDRSVLYHSMNALGGLCLMINAIHISDSPTLLVNLAWLLIALFSATRISIEIWRKRQS